MKLTTLSTLSLLLPFAFADFDIYQDDEFKPKGVTKSGFLVFADGASASCDEILAAPFFKNKADVSGKKIGVKQAMAPPLNDPNGSVTVAKLEMHFSNAPLYHWTLYRDDRETPYRMEDVKHGPDAGVCYVLPTGTRTCGERHLRAKFRCTTDVTAKDINGHAED
jgi:hypothetical protein